MSKLSYQDSIHYIEQQVGVSYHQARTTLKEISTLIKHNLNKGYDFVLDGLFQINYGVTGQVLYENKTYDLAQLMDDVVKQLPNYTEYDTRLIVSSWVKLLIDSVERGYTVVVKGVGVVLVGEDDGVVILRGRISPQIKKPDVADFIVLTDSELEICTFTKSDLRLSFSLSDTLKVPHRVRNGGAQQVGYAGNIVL